MVELVNKKTGEVIILPTPDHSKPAPVIDSFTPIKRNRIIEWFENKLNTGLKK